MNLEWDLVLCATLLLILSIVQSFLGIGILFLGTPLLLNLGYGFEDALFRLLPASLAISLLQISEDFPAIKAKRMMQAFLPWACFGTATGALIRLLVGSHWSPRQAVGVMLIAGAFLRLSSKTHEIFQKLGKSFRTTSLFGIALIHGITNMGGGLLSFFCSTLYKNKLEIRSSIAVNYAVFAGAQFLILLMLNPARFHPSLLLLILPSVGSHFVFGRRVFSRASEKIYNRWVGIALAAYGLLLTFA